MKTRKPVFDFVKKRSDTILGSAHEIARTTSSKIFEYFLVIGAPVDIFYEGGEKLQPTLLYSYPPEKPIELEGFEKLCYPIGTIDIKKVKKPYTPTADEERGTLFPIILTLSNDTQTLLYGVCLIQYQLALWNPTFLRSPNTEFLNYMKSSKELLLAPRCYCILSKFPFYYLHSWILKKIVNSEIDAIFYLLHPYDERSQSNAMTLDVNSHPLEEFFKSQKENAETSQNNANDISLNDIKPQTHDLISPPPPSRFRTVSVPTRGHDFSNARNQQVKFGKFRPQNNNNNLALNLNNLNNNNSNNNNNNNNNNSSIEGTQFDLYKNNENNNSDKDSVFIKDTKNSKNKLSRSSVQISPLQESPVIFNDDSSIIYHSPKQSSSQNNNNNDNNYSNKISHDPQNETILQRSESTTSSEFDSFESISPSDSLLNDFNEVLHSTIPPETFDLLESTRTNEGDQIGDENAKYDKITSSIPSPQQNEENKRTRGKCIRIPSFHISFSSFDSAALDTPLNLLDNYFNVSLACNGSVMKSILLSSISPSAELPVETDVQLLAMWSFPVLLRCLSFRDLLKLYSAVLHERSITFISSQVGIASSLAISIIPLMFPLVWQGPLITILPHEYLDYLDSPVPTIVGTLPISKGKIKELIENGMVIMDYDKKLFLSSPKPPKLPNKSKLNELKSIHQQFQGNKTMSVHEMNTLCKDAFRVFTSYFSTIEDNITKALLNRNEVSNSSARNQAIIAVSSSQFVDFMKDVLPCQHFTMLTSKIDESISLNRAKIKAMMEKVNGRIQATEDEIAAFDKIIASQMKKRDALKAKLDALYKSKTQLTKGYNHVDQISLSIDDM